METIELLKTQKDSIFEVIKNSGFNPISFRWNSKNNIPRIEYKDSNYFIEFYLSENTYYRKVIVSPGEKLSIEQPDSDYKEWNIYLAHTIKWLINLKRELDSANYWDKIEQESSLIVDRFDNSSIFFSATEKELVVERIGLIKEDIKTLGFNEPIIEKINDKLDHITELLDNLNKTDWFSIFIGSFISLFLTLMITPDKVGLFWKIIKIHFENWLILPK